MQYEFRGRTLNEAVRRSLYCRQTKNEDQVREELQRRQRCSELNQEIDHLSDVVSERTRRLEALIDAIPRLADDIHSMQVADGFWESETGRTLSAAADTLKDLAATTGAIGVLSGGRDIILADNFSDAIKGGVKVGKSAIVVVSGVISIAKYIGNFPAAIRAKLNSLERELPEAIDNLSRLTTIRDRLISEFEENQCHIGPQ